MRYIASTIGIDGQAIRDLMLESIEYRTGESRLTKQIQWLTDNGSCYTEKETVRFGTELGLEIRDYNEKAPHKALKMLSPREYIERTKLAG